MSAPSSLSTLFERAKAAAAAMPSPHEYTPAGSAVLTTLQTEDIAILREKFRTVNERFQYFDKLGNWIAPETVRVVKTPLAREPETLVRELREVAESIHYPPPSWELIESDLETVKRNLGPLFAEAVEAHAQLLIAALREAQSAICEEAISRVPNSLTMTIYTLVELIRLNLIPTELLRTAVSTALRRTKVAPLPDDPTFKVFGVMWLVSYERKAGFFPRTIGMEYIAKLLARPDKSIPVFELASSVQGESNQPRLDKEAIEVLKRKIEELDAEIEKAKRDLNSSWQIRCEEEREKLATELRASHGAGGRRRNLKSPAETARVGIQQALRRAYKNMKQADPPLTELVSHLEGSIRSEDYTYGYRPPHPAPRWSL